MDAHNLIRDTAHKMGVSERFLFEIAQAAPTAPDNMDIEWVHYYHHHEISEWMTNFCLDVMTGRIPLVKAQLQGASDG